MSSRKRPAVEAWRKGAVVAAVLAACVAAAGWFVLDRKGQPEAATASRPSAATAAAVPRRAAAEGGQPAVRLDEAAQRRGGIETIAPEPVRHREEFQAYGTVLDLTRLTDLANANANVKAQVETARARLEAARAAFERARTLYRDQQNVSAAQLQAAEAAFRTEQAALAAAESQRRTLAATALQEWGAVLGDALVEGAPAAARLIERREFLVQVTLPPGTAFHQPPASAAVQVPGRGARAPLRHLSPATRTDPRLQGLSYLYTAPADSGLLPGMNVTAFLPSDGTVEGLAVPEAAVVRWQGKAWVYLRTDARTFERREIATDLPAPPDAGGGYVVRGLPADARIAARGAQALLSEELRSQLQGTGDEA